MCSQPSGSSVLLHIHCDNCLLKFYDTIIYIDWHVNEFYYPVLACYHSFSVAKTVFLVEISFFEGLLTYFWVLYLYFTFLFTICVYQASISYVLSESALWLSITVILIISLFYVGIFHFPKCIVISELRLLKFWMIIIYISNNDCEFYI